MRIKKISMYYIIDMFEQYYRYSSLLESKNHFPSEEFFLGILKQGEFQYKVAPIKNYYFIFSQTRSLSQCRKHLD